MEVLSLSTKNGMPTFVRLARLPGISRIRCLDGPLLGFALYKEVSTPGIIDWETKQVARLRKTPDINVSQHT